MSCAIEIGPHHHHHLDATVFQLEHLYKELAAKFGFLAVDHCQKRPGHKLASMAYGVEVARLHKAVERKCKHISKCHDKLAYHDMKILHRQVDCLLKLALAHFVLDIKKLLKVGGVEEVPEVSADQLMNVARSARSAIRQKLADARASGYSSRSPSPVSASPRAGFYSNYAASPALGDVYVPEE